MRLRYVTKEDFAEVLGHQLKAEVIKAKDLLMKTLSLCQLNIATGVHSTGQEPLRVDKLDQSARRRHGAPLVTLPGVRLFNSSDAKYVQVRRTGACRSAKSDRAACSSGPPSSST
jgi:hypothetical protein